MGRKIKGKKHHGVKDPEKQRENREAAVKLKINNRPGKDDFQDIPKSMKRLMAVKEQIKAGTYDPQPHKKVKPRKDPDQRDLLDSTKYNPVPDRRQAGMNKPLRPLPVFKQKPGEHRRAFYYRMDQSIQSMKKRAQFEDKYKVDVVMDGTGKSTIVDREKDEVELEIEKKRNEKLAKKGIVVKSKEEKRQARREREKKRKNKNPKGNSQETLDFTDFQDSVSFGERVDAPPSLNFKKFTKLPSSKPAADGKADLLLKKNLEGVKKAKAKLSLAQKVNIEKDRQHVVEMYRKLKAQKAS